MQQQGEWHLLTSQPSWGQPQHRAAQPALFPCSSAVAMAKAAGRNRDGYGACRTLMPP